MTHLNRILLLLHRHLALVRTELDLDDGVKYNYRKVQFGIDGKLYEVLADSQSSSQPILTAVQLRF